MDGEAVRLGGMRAGTHGRIASLPDDDDLRGDLAILRLLPGEAIEVLQVLPLGGPLLVRTAGGVYAIGRSLADRLRIHL